MFELIVLCPTGSADAAVPIAGSRAGALGVVSLELAVDLDSALAQLRKLAALGHGRRGALVDGQEALELVLGTALDGLDTIVLAHTPVEQASRLVEMVHGAGLQSYVMVTRADEALAAHAAHADAVIAKGHEAGGWIGEEGSFVLSQRLLSTLRTPVFVHGGIGLHTVAAAYAAGAAGAVLDAQLLLTPESPLPASLKATLAGMDGSETATLGGALGAPFRAYARPGLCGFELLRDAEQALEPTGASREQWRGSVKAHVGARPGPDAVLPLGQDAAFAADLARRFGNVAGIVEGLRCGDRRCLSDARGRESAGGGRPARRSHGTRYPIAQGPMTRVSDRAAFAAAVAEGGGLPFLALALMRGDEVRALLRETARARSASALGRRHPGLRARRDARRAARGRARVRPPVALIAGGRPAQARPLEAQGSRPTCTCRRRALLDAVPARRRAPVRLRGPRVRRPRRAALELRAVGGADRAAARRTRTPRGAPRAVRRRHPRRPLGRDGRRAGRAAGGAGREDRRADGHRLPVHRARPSRAAPSSRGSRRRRSTASAPCCWRPRRATPPAAPRPTYVRAFERRAGAARGRGRRRRGGLGGARAAEPRPAAHRREGPRAATAAALVAVDAGRAAARGHVHDRPGRARCATR